jgi:hypothetical protein
MDDESTKIPRADWRGTPDGFRASMGDGWLLLVCKKHRGSGYFWSCEGEDPNTDTGGSAPTPELAKLAAEAAWIAK